MNDASIPVKLYTVVQVNICLKSVTIMLGKKPKLHQAAEKLKGYYHSPIIIKDEVIVTTLKKRNKRDLLVGTKGRTTTVKACERLGRVIVAYTLKNLEQPMSPVDGQKQCADYGELLKEYSTIVEDLGCLPGEHTIVIDTTVQSVMHPCRKVPFALCDGLKEELERMKSLGVIVRVEEPTDCVNSLVAAMKTSEDVCVCMDPQDLNRAVKREHYKIPTLEEIMS